MASLLSPSTPPSAIHLRRKVTLINFSSVSTNPSFRSNGKIGMTGGYHGICFTTRAKADIEQDVLEKDKESIEVDVESAGKRQFMPEMASTKFNRSVVGWGGVQEFEGQGIYLLSSNGTDYGAVGVHHVGVLCENLERSLHFYLNILGLKINEARPHDKLPYRGAWLWVGAEMIHLMELPNPDPLSGRPEHGGRDRHTCIGIRDVSKLKVILDKAGIPYTLSKSGRPAIFTRDPDANALEFAQVDA